MTKQVFLPTLKQTWCQRSLHAEGRATAGRGLPEPSLSRSGKMAEGDELRLTSLSVSPEASSVFPNHPLLYFWPRFNQYFLSPS